MIDYIVSYDVYLNEEFLTSCSEDGYSFIEALNRCNDLKSDRTIEHLTLIIKQEYRIK